MTDHDTSDTHAQTDAPAAERNETTAPDGTGPSSSRRKFMRTAAAGAGAVGLGTAATDSAGASQQDGPGQTIGTPKLEVDGNVLVDPDGNTITLRGLNVADPGLLDVTAPQRGKNAEQAIRYLTNRDEGWYPRVIRLPIEPGNILNVAPVPANDNLDNGDYPRGEFDEDDLETYCEEHLDHVIDVCEERNVYCIVDYHRHWGDGDMEWADNPELEAEVDMFWDFMAQRYGDRDHVLFELYNEPTMPGMWGDPIGTNGGNWAQNWFDWVGVAQPWLETIREHTDTVVFIGSPGWTSSPEGALLTEENTEDYAKDDFQQFEDPEDNIGFTFHIYPAHDSSKSGDWEDASQGNNGEGVKGVYEEYPLFVTEFGWDGELQGTHNYSDPFYPLEGTTSGFGEPFMEWLESSDAINWTAWCADPIWKPVMVERTFTERTQHDDEDALGDPYGDDLPVYCEDPPCEWGVMGEDVGDYDQKAGGFIKEELERLKDDNVPPTQELDEPAAPDDVASGEVTDATIELEWSSVSDATSYNVYLDGDEVDSTASTSYTFDGLDPETEYAVGVQAENSEGTSELVETTVETLTDGGEGPCEGLDTIEVDGETICNVDGDDYYRDVNGDGTVGNRDVGAFFDRFHLEAYDRDEFDYSGNGRVSHGDVVALFHSVI